MTDKNRIECLYFSQEDLLQAGCLDMEMAMSAAESAMLAFRENKILFPEKIVQIFNDDTTGTHQLPACNNSVRKDMRCQMGVRVPFQS